MPLHLLGSTGYHPNQTRHTACLMVPELGLVLDAGTAMFRVRDRLCTPWLDIFLTHAHLDHVVGLTFLFDVVHGRSVERVRVHGEPQKLAAVERHLFASELFPARPPMEFCPLVERFVLADGAVLSHFPLEHPGGSVGYRIDWPRFSLAYVTDTTARDDAPYVDRIRGVDLLIHECNFPDSQEPLAIKTGHSWTTAVARVAARAGVGRMVLTHIDPLAEGDDPLGLDAARRIFSAIELGYDEMVLEAPAWKRS